MSKYYYITSKQLNIIQSNIVPEVKEYIDHIKEEQYIGETQENKDDLKYKLNQAIYGTPLSKYKEFKNNLYNRKFKNKHDLKPKTKETFGV